MDYKDLKDGLNVLVYIPTFPNQFFRAKVSIYDDEGSYFIEISRKVEGHEIWGVVNEQTINNWFYITPVKNFNPETECQNGRNHFLNNGKYFIGDCIISSQEERHLYLAKQQKTTFY